MTNAADGDGDGDAMAPHIGPEILDAESLAEDHAPAGQQRGQEHEFAGDMEEREKIETDIARRQRDNINVNNGEGYFELMVEHDAL